MLQFLSFNFQNAWKTSFKVTKNIKNSYTLITIKYIYYTIIYYTILYYDILYYTILYYTILYYTILYYTILYYTILYYTILWYDMIWYDMIWYDMIWYDIWYDMIWYDIIFILMAAFQFSCYCSNTGTKWRERRKEKIMAKLLFCDWLVSKFWMSLILLPWH